MLWPFTAACRFPVNYALISTVTAEVSLRMAGVIASNVFFLHNRPQCRTLGRGGGRGGTPFVPEGLSIVFHAWIRFLGVNSSA